MKLLPLSLALSIALTLAACSDSNSVDDIETDSTADTTGDDNTGSEENTDTSTNANGGSDEATDTEQTTNTDEATDTEQTENTDEATDTEQTVNTDQSDTTDSGNGTTAVDQIVTDFVPPGEPAPTFADYRITFDGSWSAATHPTQFPSNAHFSGLVGAVHNDQVIFWEPGQIATDGIELMAETGGKSIFLEEINSAIDSGFALSAIDGPGVELSPGSASVEIRVTVDNPKVTIATMLAPSPDWFAGFHNIRFYEDGAFIDNLVIEGFVYDSGTDSGLSFTSGNLDTQPRGIIERTISEPSDSPFVQGLPTAGQFIIERL